MSKISTITIILLCLFFSSNAQNKLQLEEIRRQNNTTINQEFYREINKEQLKKRKDAIRFALENNIESLKYDENGEVIYLAEVLEDGTPLYVGVYNTGSAQTSRTDELYEGGELGLNLTGANLTAGVWDGGLVLLSHEAFGGRVQQLDNSNNLSSHGTHVTGTIIASGEFQESAQGMAFEGNVNSFSFFNDLTQMTQQANNGLLLSNHSYGLNPDNLDTWIFGAYTQNSRSVDIIHNNNPFYLAVFAAGNSRNNNPPVNPNGNGFDLLTDKNLAKNAIAVANVLQVSNYVDETSVQLNSSSSTGPTDDGRVKPDISTKGTNVISTISSTNSSYGSQTGTSMAAPGVTGTLLLIQELNSSLTGDFLKSHSLKALLCGTARPTGTGPGPDYRFGFGLMDAKAMAQVLLGNGFSAILEETTLNDGEKHEYEVTATNGGEAIEVTIAWNDPAGEVQQTGLVNDPTPRLVNDLDVRLIDAEGNVTFPFRLNPNIPNLPALTGDNLVDNVEKIHLSNPEGDYTIEVTHKGDLSGGSQDYTIVVTGVSDGLFNMVPATTSNEVCSDSTDEIEYVFNYQSVNSFDDSVEFSVEFLPDSIDFQFTPEVITDDGEVTLTLSNFEDAVGMNNFRIVGTGADEEKKISLSLNVLQSEEFSALDLWYPADGAENITLFPNSNWVPVNTAQNFEVEVSLDANFETILISDFVNEAFFSFPELEPSTQYYWRVRPSNSCLEGEFTEGSFTTESLECQDFEFSLDVPLTIPDEDSVEAIINVPENFVGQISDLNVLVDITHTSVADLVLTLTSPSGNEVTLLSNSCEDGQDLDAIFDDSGLAVSCNSSFPTISGTLKPFQNLSSFVGEDIAGDWILTVSDIIEDDEGVLNSFGIQFCDGTATLSSEAFEMDMFTMYPNPASNSVTINFNQVTSSSTIKFFDMNGRLIKNLNTTSNHDNIQVDLSSFTTGIYMVEILSDGNKSVEKLIVE